MHIDSIVTYSNVTKADVTFVHYDGSHTLNKLQVSACWFSCSSDMKGAASKNTMYSMFWINVL